MSAITRTIIICVVLAAAVVSAKNIPSDPSVTNIVIVKDIGEFAAKHPGIQIVPMTRQEVNIAPTMSIRYTLGSRINGDRLVGLNELGGLIYDNAGDVKIPLVYPEEGTGSILSYVELVTNQSNNEGNAYVEDGGIGERFITIILEAKNTNYFSYSVKYYGVD